MSNDDTEGSLPYHTNLLQLNNDGSSTEEFRGVIDDLTIENKKLKRRLKKYEKLHDAHLKDEKLFEVRIHGLHPDKKRELEETLRNFAASLGTSSGNEFPANGYEGLTMSSVPGKAASSMTSFQNTDSAYASMSMSGQGSSGRSSSDNRQKLSKQSAKSRQQNIHSYLHHIPEGLLPQTNPANMSERAKQKVVVRRLEQIFAGKGAAAGDHQHPLQQQEVSQMAARADRSAIEAQGQQARKEGMREANIMSRETEDPLDPSTMKNQPHESFSLEPPMDRNERDKAATHDSTGHSPTAGFPEQRPTRPLDLDPQRAQVPAENIQYIRHLGFSPPSPRRRPEAGHGYIYLNLLINMAQLHTINVTDDFIRKAILEYSDNFEMSEDGRKVRWKGGQNMTRNISDGGESSADNDEELELRRGQSPRKRARLSTRESTRPAVRDSHQKQRAGGDGGGVSTRTTAKENKKLAYTPLFFHRESSEEEDDPSSENEEDSISSPQQGLIAGASSGMNSSGMRTISTKKPKKGVEGPIIFYNKARFCTDLSGDHTLDNKHSVPLYRPTVLAPIGKPQPPTAQRSFEKRGPLAIASQLPKPRKLDELSNADSMDVDFPIPASPTIDAEQGSREPPNLEVTGIGGVYPADHFAVAVESRHARVDQDQAAAVPLQTVFKTVPARFAKVLQGADPARRARATVKHQVLSASQRVLPPSSLPQASSYMPFEDDESSDDGSNADEQVSMPATSPGILPPAAAPQSLGVHYANSYDSDEDMDDEDDDDDTESDSSLDLLATAREFDPEAVRQSEREYDANMAAEEIPAGSSAATAGGGSGFASPINVRMSQDEHRAAVRDARQPSLLRAHTSDSMRAQGLQDLLDEDSEDEEGSICS